MLVSDLLDYIQRIRFFFLLGLCSENSTNQARPKLVRASSKGSSFPFIFFLLNFHSLFIAQELTEFIKVILKQLETLFSQEARGLSTNKGGSLAVCELYLGSKIYFQ